MHTHNLLAIIIVIHPIVLLLPRLVPRVPCVIHRQALPLRPAQDAHDRLSDHLRRHDGPPVLPEEGEADVPVGVHVLVTGRGREEVHGGRGRGVIFRELHAQAVPLAGVDGVGGHGEGDHPQADVFAGDFDGQTGGRGAKELFELALDPVVGVRGFDVVGEELFGGGIWFCWLRFFCLWVG